VLTWTRLEWWKPEEKAKILPLLELLDEKLIPFVADQGGIPRIVIMTDQVMSGTWPVDSYIFNGTGYTAVQAGYYTGKSSESKYAWDFVQSFITDFPEDAFDEYYEVARQALSTYIPNIWNGTWYYYASYFPNYPRAFKMVTWLDLTAERDRLKALIDGGDTSAATAQQYADVVAQIAAINLTPAQMDEAAAQESAFRTEYESRRPELFGLIELYVNQNNLELLYLPPSDMDLSSVMYALLGMTDAEFKAKYAAFPLVTRRFDLLKTAFEDAGIDLDLLRL
jgi:hypothetical protein